MDEVRERIKRDALVAGLDDDGEPLRDGGTGASAYGEAVGVYLAFALSRQVVAGNALVTWNSTAQKAQRALGRQTLPMVWDYCEANPFGGATGAWESSVELERDPLQHLGAWRRGHASQLDAAVQSSSTDKVVSTDPPYYDNIGYADLSDFFYVWLRRVLQPVFPDLFATLAVPKTEELVATPYRHGSKEKAEAFFLDGMTQAMRRLADQAHPAFPVTIYYAYKQAETDHGDGAANTGWDTFLAAVIKAGFEITGTWPIRTEMTTWTKGRMNALASSIVLVCRKRAPGAPEATRREFVAALKQNSALRWLTSSAATSPRLTSRRRLSARAWRSTRATPGFSTPRESRSPSATHWRLINATLDEALAEQEGDFDPDTRWALAWFEHAGFAEGEFGVAETLSKAKVTSVQGMEDAGILERSPAARCGCCGQRSCLPTGTRRPTRA